MQFLTVTACFYSIHHDVFRSHEWQFGTQSLLDNLRIYHQTVYHIQAQIQDTVDCQESFRNGQSLVGRIIQGSLKPLSSGSNCRVHRIYHHETGQGSDTLTSHRISLISHGGRSDLALLEWFFYFFQMLQKTDIVGKLMCARCDACQNIDHSGIYFSGIGLAGYRIALFESHLFSDHRIDLIDGFLISVEQFQETCLCSGCSLGTQQFHSA